MAQSGPCTVSEEVVTHFRKATEDGSVRCFQLKITQEEEIVQVHSFAGTGDLEADFNKLRDLIHDEANYFLIKLFNPKEWLLVTYVPDNVSVKAKMVMASAKGTLKDKLGHAFFVDEYHATQKDELTWTAFKGSKKQVDSRSSSEVLLDEIHKQEEESRTEMATNTRTIGGYHSVSIPLSPSAKEALSKLKTGTTNFAQLAIEENKESIRCVATKTVPSAKDVVAEISLTDPRFYVYCNSSSNSISKQFAFIYCCPESSASKWRMVYSTSKPAVAEELKQMGFNLLPKKIEITNTDDLLDQLTHAHTGGGGSPSIVNKQQFTGRMAPHSSAAASAASAPALGGTVKASNPNTLQHQHPIYSLMDKQGSLDKPTTKKKIVMPPPGAYNG